MSGLRLRYRISLAVIAIMLVGCMFLGSSYALWKLEFTQEQENIIKTGCFEVKIEDAEDSTSINLDKEYPIDDEKGLKKPPYVFKVHNNCTIDANYKLYLNVIKTEEDKSAIEFNKTAPADQKKTTGQIPDNMIKFTLKKPDDTNETANLLNTLTPNEETTSFDLEGKKLSQSYILDAGKNDEGIFLKAGESKEYSLKLWIYEKATVDINYKRFEAQIATIAYAVNTPATTEEAG